MPNHGEECQHHQRVMGSCSRRGHRGMTGEGEVGLVPDDTEPKCASSSSGSQPSSEGGWRNCWVGAEGFRRGICNGPFPPTLAGLHRQEAVR